MKSSTNYSVSYKSTNEVDKIIKIEEDKNKMNRNVEIYAICVHRVLY